MLINYFEKSIFDNYYDEYTAQCYVTFFVFHKC